MAHNPPESIGPYTIAGELGRGGMGVVYRAQDPALGRDVALKVLPSTAPQEMRERFLREGRLAARLRHPNIVSVLAAGEDDGMAWLAQDLIEGRPLDAVLHEEALGPAQAVDLVEQVARAVAHAHREGVIHRDIKPGNILLDHDGTPFLADFGLARDVEGSAKLSKSGQVYGTAHYMSPEQARGTVGGLDGRTDVWALGVVLYDCLTNALPFEGDTAIAVLSRVIHSEPRPLRAAAPDLPAALGVIVGKCLEKDPARRYATADALADDLARWRQGEAILAKPPSPAFRAARWARRNRFALLAGGGAAAVALAATAVVVVPQLREAAEAREAAARAAEAAERKTQEALQAKADEAERLERARPHLDRGRRILARLDRLMSQPDWTRAQATTLAGEARAEFEAALEAYPHHPDALLEISRTWSLLQEDTQAHGWLNNAARHHPNNPSIRLARAISAMRAYAHRRANTLGRVAPQTAESEGWEAVARGDLQFVREHAAGEDEIAFADALLEVVEGRPAGAAPLLQAYAERRFTDALAWQWAAYAWVVTGEYAKAEAALTKLLQLRPRDNLALSRRGVARYELGNLDGAMEDYDRAVAIAPNYAPPYVNRGALRWVRKDADGALADYNRAIELKRDDPVAYNNRGIVLSQLDRLSEARRDFDAAIRLVPDYHEAYANRSGVLHSLGDFESALADADRARELRPKFAEAHLMRAQALSSLGRLDEALAAADAGLATAPKSHRLLTERGNVLAMQDDLPGALRLWSRALEIAPDYFPALMNTGTAKMKQGDYGAAEAAFSSAIAVRPNFWNIWKNRGLARTLLQQHDGAVADLVRARDLTKPGTPARKDAEHWLARVRARAAGGR